MPLVQAKCTNCGANLEVDSTKEAAVCQYCNSAFIVEKAINNYTNYVTNHININTSGNTVNIIGGDEKAENYLLLARRAKDNDDAENAARYYSLVLETRPDDWEATFYTTYYSVAQTKIGNIPSAAVKLKNCLGLVIDLLKANHSESDCKKGIDEIHSKTTALCLMLYASYRNYFLQFRANANICQSYNLAVLAIVGVLYNLGNLVEMNFPGKEEYTNIAVQCWKSGLTIRETFSSDSPVYCNTVPGDTKESVQKEVDTYAQKIKQHDSSYVAPEVKGCFVATAVYGSYDCPQVWTLRRFRDDTLASTWYGRLFIRTYYAVSPTLVRWFGHTEWFKKFWKERLDKMVNNLQANGVESTPYQDKEW